MQVSTSIGIKGKRSHSRRMLVLAAAAALAPAGIARATDYTWTGNTNNNWDLGSNWSPGGFPSATGDTAAFGLASGSVSFDSQSLSVGSIFFTGGNAQNFTVGATGNGNLSIAAGGSIVISGSSSGNYSGIDYLSGDLNLLGALSINDQVDHGQFVLNGNITGSSNVTLDGASQSVGYIGLFNNLVNNNGFTGQWIINSGLWQFSQAGAGNGTIVLQGGALMMSDLSKAVSVTGNALLDNRNNNPTFTSTVTVAATKTLSVTTGGGNATSIGGVLAGTGNITFQTAPNASILIYGSADNTLSGTSDVLAGGITLGKDAGKTAIAGTLKASTGGFVLWAQNEQVSNTSAVVMNGGELRPSGFTETVGVLTLSANSSIDFGASGSSTLVFADSSGATWTSGTRLTLSNWGVDAADTLQIGTSTSGLTAGELAQLRFLNPTGFSNGTYSAVIGAGGVITPGSQIVLNASWGVNSNGNWTTDSNWTGGAPISADASATFGSAITAPRTVTLDAPLSIKQVTFDSAIKYTIGGANLLTIVDVNPIVFNSNGSHEFTAPVSLTGTSNLAITSGGSVTFGALTVSGSSFTSSGAGTLVIGALGGNTTTVATSGTGNTTFGTLSGVTGANAVSVGGTGVTTINGNNSYTGTTTVNTGATLAVGHNNALGSSTLALGTSATGYVDITASTSGISINNTMVLSVLHITGSNNITLGGTWTYINEGSPSDINVTNTGVTTFSGGHTTPSSNNQVLHLSGTNANVVFSGPITYILGANQNSTFEVGNVKAFTGTVTFNAANDVRSSQMRFGLSSALNNFTVGVGNDNAFQLATGAGALGIISNDGVTWTAAGGNHFVHKLARFNNTTFTGGNVLDFDGAVASSLKMDSAANQSTATAKTFTTNTTGSGRVRTRGLTAQSAATSLTLKGTGKLEVYGASAAGGYTGTTTIGDGTDSPTFLANNTGTGSATGSGAVTINAGATLGGTGRVGGAAVAVNGILSPGDLTAGAASSFSNGSVNGSLEVGGALSLNNGSKLAIHIGGNAPGDVTAAYDQVNVTGGANTVTINNGATLELSRSGSFEPQIGDIYYILTRADTGVTTYGGTFGGLGEGAQFAISPFFAAKITYLANWTGTQAGSFSSGGNDIALIVTVPEPASATMIGLGAAGLMGMRRRRRRSVAVSA